MEAVGTEDGKASTEAAGGFAGAEKLADTGGFAEHGGLAAAEKLIDELRGVLGAERVRVDLLERDLYLKDASIYGGGRPLAVCFPRTTEEAAGVVGVCAAHGWPFVARGSGTGLAGGATPIGNPVVIATSKMDEIISVDAETRIAWVQPGVLNLDLTNRVAPLGLHYAPDPSSQQVCSIGGNVANNSGGPHCLAYGVTSAHVVAMKVVLPDGSVAVLGDESPEPEGYDLRGVFVGSEGTLGIATEIAVRLTPNPPSVRTMLLVFDAVSDGAATVSGIIAAGLVPSAMEMMDRAAVRVVEAFTHAGLPTDAAAVLLVEIDGLAGGTSGSTTIGTDGGTASEVARGTVDEVDSGAASKEASELASKIVDGLAANEETIRAVASANNAREVRVAATPEERELFWKARKSAFGATSRLAPDYYLHDTVVPRTKLVEVLEKVYEIVERYDLQVINVLHAGDGNLHPLLSFDSREEGVLERVAKAAEEIMQASLDAGGVLTGEHGIGIEKRDFMPKMFSEADLAAQDTLRTCFDPASLANPDKIIPAGSRCGDFALAYMAEAGKPLPEEVWV